MAKITSLLFIMPVRDVDAAVRFYCDAFELREVYRGDNIAFVGIPDTDIAVGILNDPERAGSGPQHVGFHVDHSLDHGEAVQHVERAGGTVLERGEHAPGVPFARIADLDGNVFEV
jgi:catechol 2,3-dioxygenase-like lactoylglutathione lyase family enzyme